MRRYLYGTLILLIFAISSQAETVSASSTPFSFPSFTGIRQSSRDGEHLSHFQFMTNAARPGAITFKWSFPLQMTKTKGKITVFSLRGQTIQTFQVLSCEGMVSWNASHDAAMGLYIARIEYGSIKQNLRLIFNR